MLLKRIWGYVKTIPTVDNYLYSRHLSALKCIDNVKRIYISITSVSQSVEAVSLHAAYLILRFHIAVKIKLLTEQSQGEQGSE